MTDLDALTRQLLRLGVTPASLHALACFARDEAAHVELLTVAWNQAVYERPDAVLAMMRSCRRCGGGQGLKRLGQSGWYCRATCYGDELNERKAKTLEDHNGRHHYDTV